MREHQDAMAHPLRAPRLQQQGTYNRIFSQVYGPRTLYDRAFYPPYSEIGELSPAGRKVVEVMREHSAVEGRIIGDILSEIPYERTLVELGAGNGQFLRRTPGPYHWRNFIGIEIDSHQSELLRGTCELFPRAGAVHGDICHLRALLDEKTVVAPLMVMLQNTLGTVRGDLHVVIDEMRSTLSAYPRSSLLLSLYREQALYDWGLLSYWYGADVNGWPYDEDELRQGRFTAADGNYVSQWWSDEAVADIVAMLDCHVERRVETGVFRVIHLVPMEHGRAEREI